MTSWGAIMLVSFIALGLRRSYARHSPYKAVIVITAVVVLGAAARNHTW
jgi:hypothetical protein